MMYSRTVMERFQNPKNAGTDWNFAYDNAPTQLVTLAHQDDIYKPEYLEEVGAIVDEEPGFLSIMLHEVIGGDFKCLFDPLTDCNGRDNDNELTPAIFLIQLEHGLDINISLTCTGFHFNIKAAPSQILNERLGLLDIVLALELLDVEQELLVRQFYHFILIARIVII